MNERILALDIGDARIGIAVSDMTRLIATPVEVLHRVGWGPDVKRPSFLRSNSCLAIHILQNPSQPGFGFTNEMNGLVPLLPSAPRTGRARQRYTPGRQQCGPGPRSAQ